MENKELFELGVSFKEAACKIGEYRFVPESNPYSLGALFERTFSCSQWRRHASVISIDENGFEIRARLVNVAFTHILKWDEIEFQGLPEDKTDNEEVSILIHSQA